MTNITQEQEGTPAFNTEAIEKQLEKVEQLEKNNKLLSIEGTINWKLFVNLETNETQIVCNSSTANDGAVLALAHQMVDGIIAKNKKELKATDNRRLRITQFELQKLFGRCLDYIIRNRDKELTPKE